MLLDQSLLESIQIDPMIRTAAQYEGRIVRTSALILAETTLFLVHEIDVHRIRLCFEFRDNPRAGTTPTRRHPEHARIRRGIRPLHSALGIDMYHSIPRKCSHVMP